MSKLRFLLLFFIIIFGSFSCYKEAVYNNHINLENFPDIMIDENFSSFEEKDILKAIEAWQNASSNELKVNIYLKQKRPGSIEKHFGRNKKYIFVWKIDKNKLLSDKLKVGLKTYVGFWDEDGKNILILSNKNRVHSVMLHEMGHALGLQHDDKKYNTIMHPDALSSCITDHDAETLCRIYGCVPNPECSANIHSSL